MLNIYKSYASLCLFVEKNVSALSQMLRFFPFILEDDHLPVSLRSSGLGPLAHYRHSRIRTPKTSAKQFLYVC